MTTSFKFPKAELCILPSMRKSAEEAAENAGDELGDDWIHWFINEVHMETLSEGSGQISPDEERSLRAFAALVRVKRDELKQVKSDMGYSGRMFDAVGLALLINTALQTNASIQLALRSITSDDSKPTGPWGPYLCRLFLPKKRGFVGTLAKSYGNVQTLSEADQSEIALASLIKVDGKDLQNLVKGLVRSGVKDEKALHLCVAKAVVQALASDKRLVEGLKSSIGSQTGDASESDGDDE